MAFPARPFLRFALAASTWLPAAVAAQPVVVSDAWVRAPAPGQKVAAAYMELTSRMNLLLVAVASPAAAAVELHNTAVEGGVMKMRPVGRIELPAGKAVKLAPGGLHAMLVDLKHPLKAGDKVQLTLTVQRPDNSGLNLFTIQAVVREAAVDPPHHH
jgi:periplasmic copper chaperone A